MSYSRVINVDLEAPVPQIQSVAVGAPVAPPPVMMQVLIPDGVKGGSVILVAQPDGQQIQVQVPLEAKAGMTMHFPIQPPPSQSIAQGGIVPVPQSIGMQVEQQTNPPMTPPFPEKAEAIEQWGGGICDCLEDHNSCFTCATACCCPCYVYALNQERALSQNMPLHCVLYSGAIAIQSVCGCPTQWAVGCAGRQQIATKLRGVNLNSAVEPNPFLACCCHVFCVPCALAQEHRAIKNWRNAGGDPKRY